MPPDGLDFHLLYFLKGVRRGRHLKGRVAAGAECPKA